MLQHRPIPPRRVRTPRLSLRPLRRSDRDAFIRLYEISREHLRPWEPAVDPALTLAERFERALDRSDRGLADGTHCRLTAELDDGRLAGMFNLNNIVRGVFQNADAGWLVAADCIRRGIGTEGVTALLDVAFADPPTGLGLHRVQAGVIPRNEASLKLAERCGFRREGLARSYLKIDGRWQDHVLLAKLAGEHEIRYLKRG